MDHSNSVGGKKWLHSASLVKVKPVSFADTLDVKYRELISADLKFGPHLGRQLLLTEWGQDWKASCEEEIQISLDEASDNC